MEILHKKINKTALLFLIGLILTISLLWPLFYAPYFSMQDDNHIIRTFEMNKCFEDLQIPCRWVPDMGGEYGYPLFNFYAPLPYYVSELSYLLTHSFEFAAKSIFAIAFIGAYTFMFLLGRKLWGSEGGLLSGVFYSFAPYHALDSYVRGDVSELWALMFFPAIFWATLRLKEKPNLKRALVLGLFFAGLVLSHNLSAMIFAPPLGIFAAILFFRNRDFKSAKTFVLGIFMGILLSAFYFLPALFEKKLAHLETTIEGYFSYTEHFKGLTKLFIDRYWGYGSSVREIPGVVEDNTFPYQIGVVHWVSALLAFLGVLAFWKRDRWRTVLVGFFVLVVLGSVFMINPKSVFIWNRIQPLTYLQFPWRFLELVIFFVSIICGAMATLFKKKYLNWALVGVLLVLVVAFNFSYFKPQKFVYMSDAQILSGKSWDTLIKRSIFDYLPIYAKAPPAELATERYQLISGKANIANFQEGSNWMRFNSQSKVPVLFQWSQYYFPDWRVFVDGKEVPDNYGRLIHGPGGMPIINDLGLQTFAIPAGDHQVSAHFYNTPVRIAGNAMSVLGIFIGAGILFLGARRLKKNE